MTTEADLDEIYRLIQVELPMPEAEAKAKLKDIATAKKMLRLGIKEHNLEVRNAGGKKTTIGQRVFQLKQSLESLLLTVEKIEVDLKAFIEDPDNALQLILKRQQQEKELKDEEERQFQERLQSYRQEALKQQKQKLKDGLQGGIALIIVGSILMLIGIFTAQSWIALIAFLCVILGGFAAKTSYKELNNP